jgi:hypothetical protein
VGVSITDILDYANTNKYKTTFVMAGRDENGLGYVWLNSAVWLNFSPITSITVSAANGSLSQYTSVALYGIA